MVYRSEGRDAGSQKHITTDGIVYNKNAGLPGLDKPQDQYKVHLEDLKAAKPTANMSDILPNVTIYSDGRKRSWEMKNGLLNKIVHADGQVWTRKDKKHWNITYNGKLIGKNVELSNVKIGKDKELSWTVGGVKKTISGSGEYCDPTLKAKRQDDAKLQPVSEEKAQTPQPEKLGEEKVQDDKSKDDQQQHKIKVEEVPTVKSDIDHVVGNHETECDQFGIASWYGGKFHGRKTSSGERYDMNKLTAAHKTLPFGTRLLVTNPENGRTVIVTVTDRGPYVGKRILDLSKAAANKLNMIGKGIARIGYKII